MSSTTSQGKKVGNQIPRIAIQHDYAYSDIDDAVFLLNGYGFNFDQYQKNVLTDWLARNNQDEFINLLCGASIPRQNGKTVGIIHPRVIYGVVGLEEKILYTAHHSDTSGEAYLSLYDFFMRSDLRVLVKGKSQQSGRQKIMFTNGACIKFATRSNSSHRGGTFDLIVFDEAQELSEAQAAAAVPTVSAAVRQPQMIYCGTPPGPKQDGEVFTRLRDSALSGDNSQLCWHEWSVDKIGDINNEDRWFDANPSLGDRLRIDVLRAEASTFGSDTFARERLGWWPSVSAASVIKSEMWEPLAVKESPDDSKGKLCYGIKFSPDGSRVALAVALKVDGITHVEVIKHQSTASGITGLANWLLQRQEKVCQIAIDGKSNADALIEKLNEEKVNRNIVQRPQVADVIASSSMFLNAVTEKSITHFDQSVLNSAVLGAKKRKIGGRDGWGWQGINDEIDVTPLESVALAYWSVMTTKRNPNRKLRVG